ncbi:hypothetical protein R3P38DRAFT_2756481 [Favolaschia claudopus]|uniref:Uncharacterized protein n=1 Tax=Favolaschia claudopus TaxID=2862362 RepID=A0AAW0ED67_9AGAR
MTKVKTQSRKFDFSRSGERDVQAPGCKILLLAAKIKVFQIQEIFLPLRGFFDSKPAPAKPQNPFPTPSNTSQRFKFSVKTSKSRDSKIPTGLQIPPTPTNR